MALGTINGFSAEEATSKYVYENFFGGIQHINGKGVTDKYTMTDDVRSVNSIDVMRLKPVLPAVRKLGASNNGGFYNKYNTPAQGNSPQSVNYSIPVDLFFDRLIPIAAAQLFLNKTNFEDIVQTEVISAMDWAINLVTFAKQIEGFFRNGDNFDKAKTHSKGSVVGADITDAEIASAIFYSDVATPNDSAKAFVKANAALSSIKELGQFRVPVSARQAFISPAFNAEMKGQYSSNASEAAANINATGFMNPFTQTETKRIDVERTGLCGMYDGVPMFLLFEPDRELIYIYLGILGTANDATTDLVNCRAALDMVQGFIVAGAGTCRGIAIARSISVKEDPYNAQAVNICPLMKMGVDVLHGASIKMIVGLNTTASTPITAWSKNTIARLVNYLTFTPIDDDGALARTALPTYDFNDGTTK